MPKTATPPTLEAVRDALEAVRQRVATGKADAAELAAAEAELRAAELRADADAEAEADAERRSRAERFEAVAALADSEAVRDRLAQIADAAAAAVEHLSAVVDLARAHADEMRAAGAELNAVLGAMGDDERAEVWTRREPVRRKLSAAPSAEVLVEQIANVALCIDKSARPSLLARRPLATVRYLTKGTSA